jgi:hypothetical protein
MVLVEEFSMIQVPHSEGIVEDFPQYESSGLKDQYSTRLAVRWTNKRFGELQGPQSCTLVSPSWGSVNRVCRITMHASRSRRTSWTRSICPRKATGEACTPDSVEAQGGRFERFLPGNDSALKCDPAPPLERDSCQHTKSTSRYYFMAISSPSVCLFCLLGREWAVWEIEKCRQ